MRSERVSVIFDLVKDIVPVKVSESFTVMEKVMVWVTDGSKVRDSVSVKVSTNVDDMDKVPLPEGDREWVSLSTRVLETEIKSDLVIVSVGIKVGDKL